MKLYDKENKRLLLFEEKATADFWDRHWQGSALTEMVRYGKNSRLIKKFTARFLKMGAKVLEAGCGDGQNVYVLQKLGYDCYGVDFAVKTIANIKRHLPELKVDVQDLRQLGFADDFFDGYWCLGVIEHNFEGYADILAEATRVIKPGGYLFLAFPFMSPFRKLKARFGLYPLFFDKGRVGNFYEFILNPNTVKKDICHYGFNFILDYSFDATKGLKDEVFWLNPSLKKIYSSQNILAKALRYLTSILFAFVFGHSILLVFQKKSAFLK